MESLVKYSHMPLERIDYRSDADTSLILEIGYGVLFIMAFWSGPSVKAFSEITEIIERLDPMELLKFAVIDTDGAQSFYTHPEFKHKMGGWGEIWINNGEIQCTSGVGYNPSCFEPNTRALL